MILIIDYGVGNLRSIENMLRRAGVEVAISSRPDEICAASKLILPGVGHFGFGMDSLRNRGLVDVLNESVLHARVPILGICLGAQLMGRRSEEGDCAGLNWVAMDIVRFDTSRMNEHRKVPHMGWADTCHTECPLFQGMSGSPRFYYVHSYHFQCDELGMVICTAEHGYRFAAGIACGNIFGVQFHPEKSHVYGLQLLQNFASMEVSRLGAS
ncbi:MAG: imidazole glycerol phosphate synthase subunit HisH [Candidatus Acidiferrales bacterium]